MKESKHRKMIARELLVPDSATTVWLDASGAEARATIVYAVTHPDGGALVSDSQAVQIFDASIPEHWRRPSATETVTYGFSAATTNIWWDLYTLDTWDTLAWNYGSSFEIGLNLPFGDYGVSAWFDDIYQYNPGEAYTSGRLHIVDVDIERDVYVAQVDSSAKTSVALDMAKSSGAVNWRIEPDLPDGARLHTSSGGILGTISINNRTSVWVSVGDIATNYTVTAYHPNATNIYDTAQVLVFKVEEISVTSPKAGASANPPPFEGGMVHPFDPSKPGDSPDPDKHFVVFYKDVVDANFNVLDFDITLKAKIVPTLSQSVLNSLNPRWTKLEGPDSGSLSSTIGVEVVFRNPKVGGVYKFAFDLDGYPRTEFCVVLPLAGASVDAIMAADMIRAQTVAAKIKAKHSFLARQIPKNGKKWFVNHGAGDYLGRPNNVDNKTVWVYNQVDDTTGHGAIATWKGKPIHVGKLNNFMVGYLSESIEVIDSFQTIAGMLIGTENDEAAKLSWTTGNIVAHDILSYDIAVSLLVVQLWNKIDDNEKTRKLWPNLSPADNYFPQTIVRPWNTTFSSPYIFNFTDDYL